MTSDQVEHSDEIYVHETEAIESLRSRGFAVIVWSPSELKTAARRHVEDYSVAVGWDIIESLQEQGECEGRDSATTV